MQDERYSAIECILFVSGEPVSLVQLQRALDITGIEMNAIIHSMEKQYRQEERGIQLYITDDTVQLVSNKNTPATLKSCFSLPRLRVLLRPCWRRFP